MSQNSTELDMYSRTSPIDCYILNLISMYCVVLLCLSLFFNIALLVVFGKNKKLRSTLNMFIMAITILNLFGSISELSFVIPTNMKCKWIFGKAGCDISAFIMYTVGCSSIHMLAALSVQRFMIIYKPFTIKKITYSNSLVVIGVCILFGLFWASMPLYGWSHYALEAGLTTCAVEWADQSWNVYSYNVSIFIFVFAIPVFLIVFCNAAMLVIIKRMPVIQDEKNKARLEKEKRLTFTLMLYVTGFLISWTPYAFVSMYSVLINPKGISPLGSIIPSMFAKSSMVWSTILFIYSNRNIKSKFTFVDASKASVELGSTGLNDNSTQKKRKASSASSIDN